MLLVITSIQAFRLNPRRIELTYHNPNLHKVSQMSYTTGMEVAAYRRGEPATERSVSMGLRKLGLPVIPTVEDTASTPITCTDGTYTLPYLPETLARTFTYFADFFSEYPGEPVPLPFSTSRVDELFPSTSTVLFLQHCMYDLQILNPVTYRYYLAFDLEGSSPDTIISILDKLSEDDRIELQRLHQAKMSIESNQLPLPRGGEGHAILAATTRGKAYLATLEGSTLLPHCPSWLFYNALMHEAGDLIATLAERGFDEEEEYLNSTQKARVIDIMTRYISHSQDEVTIRRVGSMLGVGETRSRAPYGIGVDLERGCGWNVSLNELREGLTITPAAMSKCLD